MKAKIWNYSVWINECDPRVLKSHFEEILKKSGFKILDIMEHYFEPQGYTAVFLLAESHLAIHTFPECNKTYLELSSCNLEYYVRFIGITKDL